jgi:hypothetical protein
MAANLLLTNRAPRRTASIAASSSAPASAFRRQPHAPKPNAALTMSLEDSWLTKSILDLGEYI